MGLALVHFQKYWLLRATIYLVCKSFCEGLQCVDIKLEELLPYTPAYFRNAREIEDYNVQRY